MEGRFKMFEEIAKEIVNLQQDKNADYGSSFQQTMNEFGLISLAIRLNDKFNRFKTLIKNSAKVRDESLEDTLMDLAAYAIMGIEWLRKEEPEKIQEVKGLNNLYNIPINWQGVSYFHVPEESLEDALIKAKDLFFSDTNIIAEYYVEDSFEFDHIIGDNYPAEWEKLNWKRIDG